MNGWCQTCGGIEKVARTVHRPRWLTKPIPHWDYSCFIEVDLCQDGHALSPLCHTCNQAPAYEGYDDCLSCIPDEDKPAEYWVTAAEYQHDFRRDQAQPVAILLKEHS
jgi:hypothetical protein